jgi:ArsR family transcriptional regulator, virulence genes transcriptional regulator
MTAEEEKMNLDPLQLKKAVALLRAVNHQRRQDMLHLLHREGCLTVSAVYQKMGLEQSLTSQHLGVLRKAGIVVANREGNQVYYSVNYRRLHELQQMAKALLI